MIHLALLLWIVTLTQSSQELVDDRQQIFNWIKKYELIHVNLDGFSSNNIIEFDAFNKHYKVQLWENELALPTLLHPNDDGTFTHHEPVDDESCYYHGQVLDIEVGSRVALSLCEGEGIRGTVHIHGGDNMNINPTTYYDSPFDTSALTDQHLIYNASNYNWEEARKHQGLLEVMPSHNDKPDSFPFEPETPQTRRRLASAGSVELATLIDKNWVDYFRSVSGTLSYFKGVVNDASSLTTRNNLPSDLEYSITYRYAVFDDPRSCSSKKSCADLGNSYLKKTGAKYDYGFYFIRDPDRGGLGAGSDSCGSDTYGMSYDQGPRKQTAKVLAHELAHNNQAASGSAHDDTGSWIMDPHGTGDTWSPLSIEWFRKQKNRGKWSCFKRSQGSGFNYKNHLGYDKTPSTGGSSGGYYGGSGSSGTCIKAWNFKGGMSALNGYYSGSGNKYVNVKDNHKSFQKIGSYWTVNGKMRSGYGWCRQSSILSCSGNWDTNNYGTKLGSFRKSSGCGVNAMNVNDCFDNYEKTMCFSQGDNANDTALTSDETQEFGLIEEEGCFNDEPVFGYMDNVGDVMYYIHKNDYDTWVLTDGTLGNDGDVVCEEEDLYDCVDGKWKLEVVYDDQIRSEVMEGAMIEGCSASDAMEEKRSDTVDAWLVVSVVLFVIVLVGCGAFIWYYHRVKWNTKGKFEIRDESGDEAEEIEVTANTHINSEL